MHQWPIALSCKKLKKKAIEIVLACGHLSIKGFQLNILFYDKTNNKNAELLLIINNKINAH